MKKAVTKQLASYLVRKSTDSASAYVETGREIFLVTSALDSGAWKTFVFERVYRPDSWVLRREIAGLMDPSAAVTGHVLGPTRGIESDPFMLIKSKHRAMENAYLKASKEISSLREENSKLLSKLKRRGRRG